MSTIIETTKLDQDGDGSFDEQRVTNFVLLDDGKVDREHLQVTDLQTGAVTNDVTQFYYNDAGQLVSEAIWKDTDGDGLANTLETVDRTYDAEGRLVSKISKSPDFDGDGYGGDYRIEEFYSYNDADQTTAIHTDYIAFGYQAPSDYSDELFEYDRQGRLTKHTIDDPTRFDNTIIYTYNYKRGVLQNIKTQDEYRFGDERPHITESFTYNKDGSLKTSTEWAGFSDQGWMQRVDTEYVWRSGYDSQRIKYDVEGDFDPEHIKFVENWYNSDEHLTHTLTTYDNDADGKPDSRDLFVKTWEGDMMVAETRDYDIWDGVVEYEFTSELLVA